jgi:hypothetical protein
MHTTEITDPIMAEPSRLLRAPVSFGIEMGADSKAIEETGGIYQAGLIRRAAVITRGEALGHGMWIDDTMLAQVATAINDSKSGIKSRFAHPSMSGDGIGRAVGRYQNAVKRAGIVRADLHILSSAHETPDGDLGGYVMKLAGEDPEAFGNSIAFSEDQGEMQKHRSKHTDEAGKFTSPDELNTNNYPHVRLSKLDAVDVVDEPAANPDGLFHRGFNLYANMDAFLAYVLCQSEDTAQFEGFPNADRVRDYVQRYLTTNKLKLVDLRKDGIRRRLKMHIDKARAEKEMF